MANKRTAPRPPAESRPVDKRGQEYEAEKLTGKRAQRGLLPGGAPRWTYEVKWRGAWANTYEPASCLVGWESEMKKIDDEYSRQPHPTLTVVHPNQ